MSSKQHTHYTRLHCTDSKQFFHITESTTIRIMQWTLECIDYAYDYGTRKYRLLNQSAASNAAVVIHCVQKKHPLMFSFISRRKMFQFTQNFDGMFASN